MTVQSPRAEVEGEIAELEHKTVLYIRAKGSYSSVDFNAIFARLWNEVKR